MSDPRSATSPPDPLARLQPAAPAEQDHEGEEHRGHHPDDEPERVRAAFAGDGHVHPVDRGDEREREQDHRGRRQDPERVVQAMGDDRLVRRFERLDDLLVVLERVPDPLGGVGHVVEVDLHLLGEVALLRPLEVAQDRALGPDDPPEVDDLLLGIRDVADDLARAALKDVVLEPVELVAHLAQHREGGVDVGVDDPV